MSCTVRCKTAKTPKDKCECSCEGKNHGTARTLSDFEDEVEKEEEEEENGKVGMRVDNEPSQLSDKDGLHCENCGAVVTKEGYCAVSSGTLLEDELNLGSLNGRDHHVVCDGCYERGAEAATV